MAELAIGIAGVALAWKGIMDFGTLVKGLTDDGSRQRDIMAIKLECFQLELKDWGDYWGVTHQNGRFHGLETARKDLIMKIIFQLRDSRARAVLGLRKHYGLTTTEEENDDREPGRRLSRMVDRLLSTAKKGKEKSRWLIHDQAMISGLVQETKELHEILNAITSLSLRFLGANMAIIEQASSLRSGFMDLERQVTGQGVFNRSNTPSEKISEGLDDLTLTSFSAKSITSSEQLESVQNHINRSIYLHGDTRVPEAISAWWNNEEAGILLLEVSDHAADGTATAASVLLYHLVNCQKLIFVFEGDSQKSPRVQFHDMLENLIHGIISLRGNQPLSGITLPVSITDLRDEIVDSTSLKRLAILLHQLLEDVLDCSNDRILLIIDGFELISMGCLGHDDSWSSVVCFFVSGLRTICQKVNSELGHALKVLIGHKGHATMFYDYVGQTEVVDLTDRAPRETCMKEELAVALDY